MFCLNKIASYITSSPNNANNTAQIEEERFEKAKIEANSTPLLSGNIQSYGLNNVHRFEIATIVANGKHYYNLLLAIKNYALNENQRFEISKILADRKDHFVPASLSLYNLTEEHLFEVLKINALHYPELTAEWIDKCNLNNADRTRLITHLFITNYPKMWAWTTRYKLSTEEDRFKDAKNVANQPHSNIWQCIDKYNLTEDHRFEIAKIIAEQENEDGASDNISVFLQFYKLSEKHRVEIAKIRASKPYHHEFLTFFDNYKINNENDRFDIAKLLAKQNPQSTSDNIQKFNLTYAHRLEIARICTTESEPQGISKFIQNYQFKDSIDYICYEDYGRYK